MIAPPVAESTAHLVLPAESAYRVVACHPGHYQANDFDLFALACRCNHLYQTLPVWQNSTGDFSTDFLFDQSPAHYLIFYTSFFSCCN